MTTIIIECKLPAYATVEEYEIEIDYDTPQCCGRDMNFCNHTTKDYQEIWECLHCGSVETFYAGMYGSYFLTMNEQEYQDYKANERQKALLIDRYGTEHPRHIADYWIRN